MRARPATPEDAATIARIYNEGIADRTATFETRPRSEEDVRGWFDRAHPILAVEDDAGTVVAFASSSTYRPRECYAGIAEFGVYVTRAARRQGAGKLAMSELLASCRAAGFWKLLSRVFVDNAPSRALLRSLGFREVGTYYRHAKLDGAWRDVVIVEKFLAPLGGEAAVAPSSRPGRDAVLGALRGDDPSERARAVDDAREIVEQLRAPDLEILDAAVEAFVGDKTHHGATRARFAQLFRVHAALGPDAARDLFERLFAKLSRWSLALDGPSFYEVLFVIRQTLAQVGGRTRVPEVATHLPELVQRLKETIELPHDRRARISPANLASLIMSLALALCETDAQRQEIAALVPQAMERHRVDPPSSIRPPTSSAAPEPISLPPPPPLPVKAARKGGRKTASKTISAEAAPKKTRRGGKGRTPPTS